MQNSLTLSQFQQILGNTIRCTPSLQNAWVQAEFSDLRISGGHCYMELIEKDSSGTTRAKMRAIIWSGTLAMIKRKFYEVTGRDIASGMKVLVYGSATHHNLYGLSFTITDIDPSYTLGDMERIRREILERLTREGIINANKTLPVPIAPQRIAVISSEGAAGYGDFINQIKNNPDRLVVYTMLFPSVMQGERTAPEVIHALDLVEMTARLWDAVVIIRGGGATTDLNGFDNYDLARRVATFPLPVIVGIGHERDRTVLDEVACVRCKTPTAAAAYIIDALRGEYIRLSNLAQSVPVLANNALVRNKMKISSVSQAIVPLVKNRVLNKRIELSQIASRIDSMTVRTLSNQSKQLEMSANRLRNSCHLISQQQQMKLQRLDDMLRLLSPENTLKRGYSITRIDGKAVTSLKQVRPGVRITTNLSDGVIVSTTE